MSAGIHGHEGTPQHGSPVVSAGVTSHLAQQRLRQ